MEALKILLVFLSCDLFDLYQKNITEVVRANYRPKADKISVMNYRPYLPMSCL